MKTKLLHISQKSDIIEDDILKISKDILLALLKDNSSTNARYTPEEIQKGCQVNIFWATDIYEKRYGRGQGYDYHDQITITKITGENGSVVQPRVNKTKEEQVKRSRDKAEVFTPSWICNKQNNLIDNIWFGRENVFNTEIDTPNGLHDWKPTEGKIQFPDDIEKTWSKYVCDTRLEITCGEAPYIASRYDTITGDLIPLNKRIGLLDRKMRIINENATNKQWWHYCKKAYQSVYGYDWQGDNVLLARETLFVSFIEYYYNRFKKNPSNNMLLEIAQIISWNIWQMDGIKFVIPESCHAEIVQREPAFFVEDLPQQTKPCKGCLDNNPENHNGVKCVVRDWFTKDKKTGKNYKDLLFYELLKQQN